MGIENFIHRAMHEREEKGKAFLRLKEVFHQTFADHEGLIFYSQHGRSNLFIDVFDSTQLHMTKSPLVNVVSFRKEDDGKIMHTEYYLEKGYLLEKTITFLEGKISKRKKRKAGLETVKRLTTMISQGKVVDVKAR